MYALAYVRIFSTRLGSAVAVFIISFVYGFSCFQLDWNVFCDKTHKCINRSNFLCLRSEYDIFSLEKVKKGF